MLRKSNAIEKARAWNGVLYPENMIEDWKSSIGDKLQVPYAYCVHDKDVDKKKQHRKDHVHITIMFSNTTTAKHALEVFSLLSQEGKKAINTCEAVVNIRNSYEYLIHNTEDSKKKKKHLYDVSERICGNGFDIGAYEQIGTAERLQVKIDIKNLIRDNFIINFSEIDDYLLSEYEDRYSLYFDVFSVNSNFFNRLIDGNYQKLSNKMKFGYDLNELKKCFLGEKVLKMSTEEKPDLCPLCGSSKGVVKRGKTKLGEQRYSCKNCGKIFR